MFIYSIILSSATVAPQVTVHPVDQTNIVPGSNVSFSVTASGTEPLSYQWQKDGVDLTDGSSITGATTATLTIAGVMESDEGGYRCVVTNTAGMDTANTAVLTVGKKFCIEIIFSIMMLVVGLYYTTNHKSNVQLFCSTFLTRSKELSGAGHEAVVTLLL